MSKTYPAFIVCGIALVAVLMPLAGFADRTQQQQQQQPRRFTWKNLLILLTATLVTIAPWTISCMIRFPREFWYEQAKVSDTSAPMSRTGLPRGTGWCSITC